MIVVKDQNKYIDVSHDAIRICADGKEVMRIIDGEILTPNEPPTIEPTIRTEYKTVYRCPNCGAVVAANECEYCGTRFCAAEQDVTALYYDTLKAFNRYIDENY